MGSTAKGAGGGLVALVFRCVPALLLPAVVACFEPEGGLAGLPLILISVIFGVAIVVAVPRALLGTLTAGVVAGFLLSASYLQELQSIESAQEAIRQRPRHHLGQWRLAQEQGIEEEPGQRGYQTMSIVLPCAMEGSYAGKTVDAILANTVHTRIHEIIVVDDGSTPPLKTELPGRLLRGRKRPPIRIIRNEKTMGLIATKKIGGDAARGDIIVFLDCHVKPREGWEEALIWQMRRAGDHRTIAVPTITSLDIDTWEEVSGAQAKACYLMLSGDFTWLMHPGRDVPMMSGGLLSMTKRWWNETRGLDGKMIAWGGENIDQSLRTWLCGGRIEHAQDSYVAHMWRDADNPKTQLKYPIPTEHVMRNKARAVSAWFSEFREKTFTFPEYEEAKGTIGDMSEFETLRSSLNCKPFSHYIQRFKYVYLDAGLIPESVFQLRETASGLCLERVPKAKPPHSVTLAACTGGGPTAGNVTELQLWHAGNRDLHKSGGPCCSGLKAWNFNLCLFGGRSTDLHMEECDIDGHNSHQFFSPPAVGAGPGPLHWGGGKGYQGCVVPGANSKITRAPTAVGRKLAMKTCAPKVGQRLLRHDARLDDSGFLIKDLDTDLCVGIPKPEIVGGPVTLVQCAGDQRWVEMRDRQQLKHVGVGYCLDGGKDENVIAYPCHEPTAMRTQKFEIVDLNGSGWVRIKGGWEDNGRVRFFERCLDYDPLPSDTVRVEDCAIAELRKVRWERVGSRVPLEWSLWQQAKASLPPPGEPPLGGSADPP